MWFMKSKAEKQSIGDAVTCQICGKKYYELKTPSLPVELIGKYEIKTLAICNRCGRVYCMGGGFGMSCTTRTAMNNGCQCSQGLRFEVVGKAFVQKRNR